MKYEHLFRLLQHLLSVDDVLCVLVAAVPEFNGRPNAALHGLTPNEALAGEIVVKRRFAEQIRAATLARPAINRADLCGLC